mmetsp:Transcript_4168/g.4805  ORF Transcript_4168/g.4805 Transcript_4168/m.4805 type:complete len:157 (-) Transcript_4168:257-727(-)
MATTMLNLSSGEQGLHAQLLPCAIEYNGPAQVSKYFTSSSTGTSLEGAEVLAASFRGRYLKGCHMDLPSGFTAHVITQQAGVSAAEPTASDEGPEGWTAVGAVSQMTYWNHDDNPTSSDALRRAMEWTSLSKEVHGSTTAADVDRMAAKIAAGEFP